MRFLDFWDIALSLKKGHIFDIIVLLGLAAPLRNYIGGHSRPDNISYEWRNLKKCFIKGS